MKINVEYIVDHIIYLFMVGGKNKSQICESVKEILDKYKITTINKED